MSPFPVSQSPRALIRPVTSARRAFSLIELLTVMGIASLLAATAVPALRGPIDAINVSGAASIVDAEISLARQTAMTRNLPVEVRVYEIKDALMGDHWRLISSVIPASASGKLSDEFLSPVAPLPGKIVLEDLESFSTIISAAAPAPTNGPRVAPWKATEATTAPPVVRGMNYVAFQFNPDGSTNLPSTSPWCMTLRNLHSKPEVGRPADNFVSIVVDSHTGRTLRYQP